MSSPTSTTAAAPGAGSGQSCPGLAPKAVTVGTDWLALSLIPGNVATTRSQAAAAAA